MRHRATIVGLSTAVAALAFTAAVGGASSAERSRSGVYSSFRISPETDDAGGMEVEVRDGASPTVVVTACEGGCWGGKSWPAEISGRAISFTVIEEWFDAAGKVSDRPSVRYRGRFVPGALILESPDRPYMGRERLRRVRQPVPGQTAARARYP